MGGHAEDMADGDHTGAADAGDEDRPRPGERRQLRLRQERKYLSVTGKLLLFDAFDQFTAFYRHEARAEAFDTGIVLVAGRLVDLALAAERRLDRHDRHAVRFDAAIAAALADKLVDEHPFVGIGKRAALAPPPLLGGTGLVIDDDARPRNLHELLLYRLEIVAVVERHRGRKAGIRRILVRLVRYD